MGELTEAEYRHTYPWRVRRFDVKLDRFVTVQDADWEMLQRRLWEKGSSWVVTGRTQVDWNSAWDELLWRMKMNEGVVV